MSKQRIRASQVFNYLHCRKTWNEKIDYLSTRKLNYHLNSYMDLTIEDIAYYTTNFDTLKEVKEDMYQNYDKEYAESWFDNLLWVLAQKGVR